MNEKIYEALRDEPNVDMVIIAKQYDNNNIESKMWDAFNRAYALEQLSIEAKFVWDEFK